MTGDRSPAGRGISSPPLAALAALVILAVVVALYGRTASFGFSYLDDDVLIIERQDDLSRPGALLQSFARPYFPAGGRDHSYYRPLVSASYVADAVWTGVNARGYHLTNIGLHGVAALLVFLLLRRFSQPDGAALCGALWFAVNPALTSTVAWIPGRNDSLLAIFALASWCLLLGAMSSDSAAADGSKRIGAMLQKVGHLLAWSCALFTKETALVLPLLYAAHLLWLERRPWRALARPWLLGGWAAALVLYLVARSAAAEAIFSAPGAQPDSSGASILSGLSVGRIVANVPLLVGGLGKIVLPVHLSVLAIPEDTWLWPGLMAAAILVAVCLKLGGERRRTVTFGTGVAIALLAPSLPASNLLFLENRLYLPTVGIALVVAELARGLARDIGPTAPAPLSPVARAKLVAGVLAIGLLAGRAWFYSADFRDRLTFAQAAVRQSPHSSLALRNLGVTYQIGGDSAAARRAYQDALTQDAAEPVAHNNLGVLLMAEGRLADAETELRQELGINPRYARAHHNLALVLSATNRTDEAAHHFEMAVTLNPRDTEALRALARHYAGRDPRRAAHFQAQLDEQQPAVASPPP